MLRIFILLLLGFVIPFNLLSQILPKEGSSLNYRLIGFSFPAGPDPGHYKIEIAEGTYNNTDSFTQHIVEAKESDTNRVIAMVPAFGSSYTWRSACIGKHTIKSELHHFSTLTTPNVDTSIRRLRIVTPAKDHKDDYVFVDCTQALYDMNGNPVWFIPNKSFATDPANSARDLKLSPLRTITYMMEKNVYEISYNEDTLWQGPTTAAVGGDTTEHYHHEFTRLANGHYMVMGLTRVLWNLPSYQPDSMQYEFVIKGSDSLYYQRFRFGTMIEYDEKGNVVWSWNSTDYFKKSDLYENAEKNGTYAVRDVHPNSFFFDEKKKVIYIGFRDISRIIKVKYPEGTVLAEYGKRYSSGEAMANELFLGQHSIRLSMDGLLYVFNNNSATGDFPKVIMMREPTDPKGQLEKTWEYTFMPEGMNGQELGFYNRQRAALQKKTKLYPQMHLFSVGGNAIELPDRSLFISMNSPRSTITIITRNKETIWSGIMEEKHKDDSTWSLLSSYRASIIDHNELEQLIWNVKSTTANK